MHSQPGTPSSLGTAPSSSSRYEQGLGPVLWLISWYQDPRLHPGLNSESAAASAALAPSAEQ